MGSQYFTQQMSLCGRQIERRNTSPCSASTSYPVHEKRFVVCAADAMCRDMVNVPKDKKLIAEGSVTVTFLGAGGQSQDVECPLDTYILDAGLDSGLELPYTCRGGICGACVGRVTSGQVDQSDVDNLAFTLDESEVAQGMALLCMSRPMADCVIETQSDWGYSLGVAEWKGPTGHIKGKDIDHM